MTSVHSLNTQFIKYFNQPFVKALVRTDTLGEGYIDNVVVAVAYHHVALALLDGLDGTYTRTTGQDAVTGRRTAAALQVAEDGNTHIEPGKLMFHTVGIVEGAALGTLRDDDDT